MSKLAILTVTIRREHDVVAARQRARQIAALVGFDVHEQTRIATAVSEIARNAFHYAENGKAEFSIEGETLPQVLLIRVSDKGRGIKNLREILDGRYSSPTGMGLGILGARRLMDSFQIHSDSDGTIISLRKIIPHTAPLLTPKRLGEITGELARQIADDPLAEIQRQNQELLQALGALRERQEELLRLNRELEDTNRGVVALYAELDEKAESLRRADMTKTRFLSNMSHEFRTPLNAQLAITRILLDRMDGELTAEQEKQVRMVRQAAENLLEMVNDLLDIAKIEAGKIELHPSEFEITNLFSALRGMLRPILVNSAVELLFDDTSELPTMYSDEGKISQILRNFLSNAIKFTEQGEIRVTARLNEKKTNIIFSVSDTGIGIAPENLGLIFEEFAQVANPLQRRVKGTGLGLPLCKKLTEILGGHIAVSSVLGTGSIFTAEIPLRFAEPIENQVPALSENEIDSNRTLVLVVEDSSEQRFIYERYFLGSEFQALFAKNIREARQSLTRFRPQAMILDILLQGEDSWNFLAEIKHNPETASLPIIVATTVEDAEKGVGLGADAFFIKPVERLSLIHELHRLIRPVSSKRVLVIDDEETMRYLYRKLLRDTEFELIEADSGRNGLQLARDCKPDLICLDLAMPDIGGEEVLQMLKTDSETAHIPVVIVTSKPLQADTKELAASAAQLSKTALSSANLREMLNRVITEQL